MIFKSSSFCKRDDNLENPSSGSASEGGSNEDLSPDQPSMSEYESSDQGGQDDQLDCSSDASSSSGSDPKESYLLKLKEVVAQEAAKERKKKGKKDAAELVVPASP